MKTIINPEYKYSELTGKIIGCAMEVHKTLGAGFQEKIYQRAMAIEMSRQGISFNEEFDITIFLGNLFLAKVVKIATIRNSLSKK